MRMREIRSYVNKEKKRTGLPMPPIEIVFRDGKKFVGNFWFFEGNYIGVTNNKFSKTRRIRIREIKSLSKPTIHSMSDLLWQYYEIADLAVESAVEITKRGKNFFTV